MKLFIGSLISLVLSIHVGAEPLLKGRVRLSSGQPAVGLQVRLFDLTDLRRFVDTTTDAAGYFTLPLQTLSQGSALPHGFTLGQNYPNPFNPSTIIPYKLPIATHVRLEVFNILGQRLATLVDAEQLAGVHTAQWDATDAAGRAVGAGMYIYRLSISGVSESRRMVLVDGQAGISAVRAAPGPIAEVADDQPTLPAYGLTVSGAGLAPYVDADFRVGVYEADIVLEEHDGSPLMKRTTSGLLGDVNDDGQVDVVDALFVAMYSVDPSALAAHIPNIALGDVDADGDIDLTDAYLIGTYSTNPSDPMLPLGIGEIVPEVSEENETSVEQDTDSPHVYWTDWGTDKIQRANLDGSNIKDLIIGTDSPGGLALDVDEGKIYWTDEGKIQRANLDGSNIETLVTGLENATDLALDLGRGKMYWPDAGREEIQRANLDGSNIETLVTEVRRPVGIALDIARGKIYWTDWIAYKIQRANLDGSNIETLVTGLENPNALVLDVDGGKIYWTDLGTYSIQRANLDGSNIETLVSFVISAGIALDIAGGKIYWTDMGRQEIRSANLDGRRIIGSDGRIIFQSNYRRNALGRSQESPGRIILDVDEGKIYWTDSGTDDAPGTASIQCANLDGSNFKSLVPELESPTSLALDVDEGKIYWTDFNSAGIRRANIRRANLDGSNIEILATGVDNPTGLALDVDGGKIYWIDNRTDIGRIRRANLDGSNARTLVTGSFSFSLALDVDGGKIYWTDWGTDWGTGSSTGNIQRANLDGSNIQTLVTGLDSPIASIALDVDGGKIYWTDLSTDNIQRANLDGSNIEVLVTGVNPAGIALDVDGGKIYWTDSGTDDPGTGSIQRANLDGSNIETFVTELVDPVGIALEF